MARTALLGLCAYLFSVTMVVAQGYHWIDSWTNMPQLVESNNLPPSPFAQFRDATLRQTLQVAVSSDKIRIVLSNTFGGVPLPITSATVAFPVNGKAGVSGIQASTLIPLTFNGGSRSVTVPTGQTFTSDELNFPVKGQQVITVSLYLQQGQQTSNIDGHPGSRTTSWLVAGNKVDAADFSGTSTVHWYLLGAVQSYVPADYGSLMILGDSITDGRGSEDNANNRWPNLLLARLQSSGLTNVAVCNQAAGGNRVLADGLGPSLNSRYKRDAVDRPGVKWIIVFEGVNDLGTGAANSGTQNQIAQQLISSFTQIARDAKAKGIKVFGATITPFSAPGGASQQSYSDPTREAARKTVNNWILTSGTFDGVIDFADFLKDASNPAQLAQAYNGGDYLHPNVAGYQHLADLFPISLFGSGPAPVTTTTVGSTTTTAGTTSIPTPTPTSGPSIPQFGQCGGTGYNGSKNCAPPYKCTVVNTWYSQCL